MEADLAEDQDSQEGNRHSLEGEVHRMEAARQVPWEDQEEVGHA